MGPSNKARHQKAQSRPAYPRGPVSRPTGRSLSIEARGPPHPDTSAEPGAPASLHQAGTARPPNHTAPRAGQAQTPRPRNRAATHYEAEYPKAGATEISLGGSVARRDRRRSPPGSTHLASRSGGTLRPFPGCPRKSTAARAAKLGPVGRPASCRARPTPLPQRHACSQNPATGNSTPVI
ncbi:hypothetical protein NDU88_003893 [Pleurodeles waltl]|uniref:Uncharacterized protein n=1 Tax=Pleurodeles waltl TaxID=8319 RepID=A0AAV7UZS7_PLEWA|nr:hypothetical protein NDU88_003893 [Pleurodeles waltl]